MNKNIVESKILIIGSGLAGLRAALEASTQGKKVSILTKTEITDSNTKYAQGGINGLDPIRISEGKDSYESLVQNTLTAGDGLCDKKVVEYFAKNSFEPIDFLIKQNVPFSKTKEEYELHQEGGHDFARTYNVKDFTGRAIEETLAQKVLDDKNITIYKNNQAFQLITKSKLEKKYLGLNDRCVGAHVIDRETGDVRTFKADAIILATGGAGRVFQYTSNPLNATGDGIAMAYNAGAKIANMEFFQFHPTVLYEPFASDPNERRFLLTEALRGETKMGGILTTSIESTEDFILEYDPRGSHATRDKVSQAIDTEMKKLNLKHVFLNVTPNVTGKSEEFIRTEFPTIYEHCLKKGIDITKQPIPVIPAAHYTCGGVLVNLNGETSIPGLYAVGEVAYTGLMGANRLASNSLTEAALFGKVVMDNAIKYADNKNDYDIPLWSTGEIVKSADQASVNQIWDITRNTMMSLCGIARTYERLELAQGVLNNLDKVIKEIYWNYYPNDQIFETKNLVETARLIVDAATFRKESRGGHYRSDYPQKDPAYASPTIIQKGIETRLLQ